MDFFIRDFHNLPHLVRFMGNSISGLEKLFRKIFTTKTGLLFAGFLIVFLNILFWGYLIYFIDIFIYKINFYLGFIVECFFILSDFC